MSDIIEQLDAIGAASDEALERFMEDRHLYLKYVRSYPDDASFNALVAAVEAQDYAAAQKSVHALKGLAGNLGFTSLADAAIDMLAELRDDNLDDALAAYEDVVREQRRYCDVIETWRSSTTA